ncbi:hypothetical protein ACFWZ7_24850 [Nocardiopsis alba]|uniref:hypothetical protein n=1 Tax=Nocardiopsis alba TaxID=53437 RepID=UPI0036704467
MTTTPTMATITMTLAQLHAAHPDAPPTRWEVYPHGASHVDAHLYADLLGADDEERAAGVIRWAELLDVEPKVEGGQIALDLTLDGVRVMFCETDPTPDTEKATSAFVALF